jgi:sterol desaturase/sphingolipid hydroxylase (fatty acid hydroxylase superfamily)
MNLNDYIQYITQEMPYWLIALFTVVYFLVLYFGVGLLFQRVCKSLHRKGYLQKLDNGKVTTRQIYWEISHSLRSIVIFGLSVLPIIYLVRIGFFTLLPESILSFFGGLLILTLWNELHFYVIHRLMHHPIFMRKVHYVHHRSITPTVFSVFSFHWLEAALLSTVPLTLLFILPLSFSAIAVYPTVSILLNFAGHCNYRFGHGTNHNLLSFGTRHNQHHQRSTSRYGFALDLFDQLFNRTRKTH